MSKALTGKKAKQAEEFYDKLLKTLIDKNLPFMIGGTYAFNQYTGLDRATGDIDLMCPQEDFPTILKELTKSGYQTELAEIELNWLAKVKDNEGYYTDIIFAERNGLNKIDRSVLENAREGKVLGHTVKLQPVEDMIRSKTYIHNRHRDDTGDVIHLILKQGRTLNWEYLLQKMEPHWELLMAHLLHFIFIYPSERRIIPKWVIKKLMKHLEDEFAEDPPKEKVTRGLLLSNDYQVGVAKWGFSPITELK